MATDPNYNPGFFGWMWDGITNPNKALNTFENNVLAPAGERFSNFIKPVTNVLDGIANSNPLAAQAMQSGVGYSSNGGAHVGSAAPTGIPGDLDFDGIVDSAVSNWQRENGSSLPGAGNNLPGYNQTMTANGQGGPAPLYPTPDGRPISGAAPAPTGAPSATASGNGGKYSLKQPGNSPDWLNPAVMGGAGTIIGGAISAGSAAMAGDAQAVAASEAAKMQSDQFNAWLGFQREQAAQQQKNITPWLNAGGNALGKLESFNTDNPAFSFSTTGPNADPSYTFRLNEGMKALQNSAAAKGGLLSGNALRGITNYGQEAASQEYNNAFNRYGVEKTRELNRLQSLAGQGQTAVGQANQASQNYTNGAGQAMMGGVNALANGITGAADARASGYIGASNALINAVGNYQSHNFLNNILGGR